MLVATSSSDEILFLQEVLEDIESGRHWRGWASIQARQAISLNDAIAILTDEPVDAVLLDLRLCGERPSDAFRRLQASAPHTPVIFIARPEETELAVRLMREGAQDFLLAHEVDAIPLAHTLGNAMERHRLLSGARAGCREDALTGLLNGTAFLALAGRDRRLAEKLGCRWMVVVAEPRDDRTPLVQPSIHEAAEQRRDLLLIQTADQLRLLAGPTDLVARIGDLRFGLGIFDSPAESVETAWSRIHSGASEGRIAIGASIFDPRHPAPLEILIEQAERDLTPQAIAMRI
ncbi:MAG TPA: response regulator [Bryobacteraceae bacterium]|nr:response regulator [Bryobacteraceae bacterium]